MRSRSTAKALRPLVRISLRTVFVLMTAWAVWLAYQGKRAHDQRVAVDRIRELGGTVTYDFQSPSATPYWYTASRARAVRGTQRTSPSGWPWLRKIIGDEFFQRVALVRLDETEVTDDDLQLVGRLKSVKSLGLSWTYVSDAGLSHLVGLKNLEHLGLNETRITSTGLRHLKKMQRLASLSLNDTQVDDAALPHLVRLGRLKRLSLERTHFSGGGLLALCTSLPDCQVNADMMDLRDFPVIDTEKGIVFWRRMVHRMEVLSGEDRLKLINLSGTGLSDEHLPALRPLVNVELIDVSGTRVTAAGLRELQKALPNCKFRR